MTDIIRKNGGELGEWNPVRVMRDLMRWDPFREMAPLLGALPSFERVEWNPSFDVTETKDAYQFKADLPGVKKEDLEITASGSRIQISGKRDTEQESKTDTVYTYERQSGAFTRFFTLPDTADIDHAQSVLKDGVLSLTIPKQGSAHTKKIPVTAAGPKS